MRARERELLSEFEEKARTAKEEARVSFAREEEFGAGVRALRERVEDLEARVSRSRDSCEGVEEEWRRAKGEAEAAEALCAEYGDYLRLLGKEAAIRRESRDRIRLRLGDRRNGDLDRADWKLQKAEERVQKAEKDAAAAAERAEETRKREEALRGRVEAERAEIRRAEEDLAAAAGDLEKASEELGRLRVESRAAMSRAWVHGKTVEGWIKTHGPL